MPPRCDRLGDDILLGRNAAAPSEPHAGAPLEQRANGDRKPARLAGAVAARDGHAVGNDDQPRQYRSSQLRERRIAVKIRPAIE